MFKITRSDGKDINTYYVKEETRVSYRDPYDNQIKKYSDLDKSEVDVMKRFVLGQSDYSYSCRNDFALYNLFYCSKHNYVPAICTLAVDFALVHSNYYEACQLFEKAVQIDNENNKNWTGLDFNSIEEAKNWLNEQKNLAKIETEKTRKEHYNKLFIQLKTDKSVKNMDTEQLKRDIEFIQGFEKVDNQARNGYNQMRLLKEFGKELFKDKDIKDFNINDISKGIVKENPYAQAEFVYLYNLAKEGNPEAEFLMAEYNAHFMKQNSKYTSIDEDLCKEKTKVATELIENYKQPEQKALELYENSANNGNKKSQYIMAFYNYEGKITKKDYEEAYKWYQLANSQDNNLPFVKVLQEYENYYISQQGYENETPRLNNLNMGPEQTVKVNEFILKKKKEQKLNQELTKEQ